MKNLSAIGYIALDDWAPFRRLFAYMDTADIYRADDLFRKYRIRVRFKREWQSPEGRYRIVFCSIPKKQVSLFEQVMEELPKRMMILGYDDYEEVWRQTIRPAEETGVS